MRNCLEIDEKLFINGLIFQTRKVIIIFLFGNNFIVIYVRFLKFMVDKDFWSPWFKISDIKFKCPKCTKFIFTWIVD